MWRLVLALTLLPACGAPPPPDPEPSTLSRALLESPPSEWPRTLPPVLARGPEAAPSLLAELRARPTAPGAQAAVGALGRLGDPAAENFLTDLVASRSPLAAEAALALGALDARDSAPLLRAAADDRSADPTLRTACACALIDLGRGDLVLPLLRAVMLAGSPAGTHLGTELGLPDRPRWALERYMVLRALERRPGGDTFGLDTDSPWPVLEAGVQAMTESLGR